MHPGDMLDLIYKPETHSARFSFMLHKSEEINDTTQSMERERGRRGGGKISEVGRKFTEGKTTKTVFYFIFVCLFSYLLGEEKDKQKSTSKQNDVGTIDNDKIMTEQQEDNKIDSEGTKIETDKTYLIYNYNIILPFFLP
jgi:hypothetical protein